MSQSQAELSLCVLQYGKKKLKYLPYNHQHEYFFLSEYPPSSLPSSWNATCPFQPSLCEQSNSSNPNSSHPSSGPCAGPKISSGISKHLEPCRARECKTAEAGNNLHVRGSMEKLHVPSSMEAAPHVTHLPTPLMAKPFPFALQSSHLCSSLCISKSKSSRP